MERQHGEKERQNRQDSRQWLTKNKVFFETAAAFSGF
jgi:hypothetical protein